jgi:hypothetical protein
MTDLKTIFIEELLNALDDIQNDVPYILDYYMDMPSDITSQDMNGMDSNMVLDIDLLSMNITSLRDSAKFIRSQIEAELPQKPVSTISLQTKTLALALFLHTHMLNDPESIYYSRVIGNPDIFNDESNTLLCDNIYSN